MEKFRRRPSLTSRAHITVKKDKLTSSKTSYVIGISDCDIRFIQYTKKKQRILVDLEVLGEEGGHFHFGEKHHLFTRILFAVLTILVFLPQVRKLKSEMQYEFEVTNYAYIAANFCAIL